MRKSVTVFSLLRRALPSSFRDGHTRSWSSVSKHNLTINTGLLVVAWQKMSLWHDAFDWLLVCEIPICHGVAAISHFALIQWKQMCSSLYQALFSSWQPNENRDCSALDPLEFKCMCVCMRARVGPDIVKGKVGGRGEGKSEGGLVTAIFLRFCL